MTHWKRVVAHGEQPRWSWGCLQKSERGAITFVTPVDGNFVAAGAIALTLVYPTTGGRGWVSSLQLTLSGSVQLAIRLLR
jgi:hypothetical protein